VSPPQDKAEAKMLKSQINTVWIYRQQPIAQQHWLRLIRRSR
jgi:hypothetical protein